MENSIEKRKLPQSKWLVLLITATVITLIIVLLILAKYINSADVTGAAVLEDFNVEIVANGGSVDEYGVIMLTPEQYENFTLSVEKTGYGWVYIRVLVEESWTSIASDNTETVLISNPGKLNISNSSDLFKSESGSSYIYEDGYIYVNHIVEGERAGDNKIKVIEGSTNTLPSGINKNSTNPKYYVKLSIKVDAIQYNRLETLWGSNTPLP